jgi:hypothetical protein
MCYTGFVAPSKQNVTLVIEEELLLSARKIALERKTSVNQLVRDFLTALVKESETKRTARARLKIAFDKGLVEIGDKHWTRDELYER